jgi:hypothetical protein
MIANANIFDRFAILDSGTASIYDVATNELETVINNCNSFALTVKGTAVEVKERGIAVMSLNAPLTGDLKFTAETTSFAQLNLALNGAGFELNSAVDTFQKTETFTVTDTSTITHTLSTSVNAESDIHANLITKGGELVKSLAFTLDVTKKIVTITTDADIAVGDMISITYFASMPVGTVYSFKVPSRGSNGTKRVVIDVLALSKEDQSPILLQFDIYKASTTSGITVTCDASKPSSFDINMTILSDFSKKVGDNDESGFFEVKTPLEA